MRLQRTRAIVPESKKQESRRIIILIFFEEETKNQEPAYPNLVFLQGSIVIGILVPDWPAQTTLE